MINLACLIYNTVILYCGYCSYSHIDYRNGVQLLSAIERKVLLQCTCDSLGERATLLEKLEETLKEVR